MHPEQLALASAIASTALMIVFHVWLRLDTPRNEVRAPSQRRPR